jgi:hypothetical protein
MKLIKEIKSKNGELHFQRYLLFKTPWFQVYIHKIYKHDEDEHLHDHPWNIFTIILKGSYMEQLLSKDKNSSFLKIRTIGNCGYRSTKRFHKIKEIIKGPVTTLAVVGKRKNDPWGYWTERGWTDHKTYRKKKNEKS